MTFVSDIAVFVRKRDVKLQLTLTASCGKVSRKSVQGRRKICGRRKIKTRVKYNSLSLSLKRYAGDCNKTVKITGHIACSIHVYVVVNYVLCISGGLGVRKVSKSTSDLQGSHCLVLLLLSFDRLHIISY